VIRGKPLPELSSAPKPPKAHPKPQIRYEVRAKAVSRSAGGHTASLRLLPKTAPKQLTCIKAFDFCDRNSLGKTKPGKP